MGNWIIYDIGFTAGDMGLIQGIGLLLAVLVTILAGLIIYMLVSDKNTVGYYDMDSKIIVKDILES